MSLWQKEYPTSSVPRTEKNTWQSPGLTPNQPSKRPTARRQLTNRPSQRPTARRQLIPSCGRDLSYGTKWSIEDKLALTNFVLLHGDGTKWIYSKKPSIWEAASEFVKNLCGTSRTSKYLGCHCVYSSVVCVDRLKGTVLEICIPSFNSRKFSSDIGCLLC